MAAANDNVTDEQGVTVTYGWSIYVRFSKKAVQNMHAQQAAYVGGALTGIACGYLPIGLREACFLQFGLVSYNIDKTFDRAADENKCVEIKFDYTGGLDGWRRYACAGSTNTGTVNKPS